MDGIPVFDFNNPWVAIIQLALAYLLPLLTGLVSDRLAKAAYKVIALGVLNVVGAALTWLLDIAIAEAWATLDWTALINVVVNAALTFFLAQGVYQGIIKPTGQAERVQTAGVSLIPADPQREEAEAEAYARSTAETIAERRNNMESVARAVVQEELAKAPVAKTTRARSTSTKPKPTS